VNVLVFASRAEKPVIDEKERASYYKKFERDGFQPPKDRIVVLGGCSLTKLRQSGKYEWGRIRCAKNVTVLPLYLPGVPILRHFFLFIQQLLTGIWAIKNERIQVLYCPVPITPVVTLLKRLFNLPLIVRVQADSAYVLYHIHGKRILAYFRLFCEKTMFKAADLVLPMSHFTARYAVKHGANPDRVIFQPFKILDLDCAKNADGGAVRRLHGISRENPLVLCIARLVPEKGLTHLLHAMRIVKGSIPDAVLLIVGNGPLENTLKALAHRLNLSDSVFFVGQVRHRDIWHYIAACDTLVLPSIWPEGLGIVLIEAMLMKKPVIGSKIGGINDVIIDGKNGYLVPPGEVRELADRIIRLLSDQELSFKFGEEGEKIAREYAGQFKTIEDMLPIFPTVGE
jgi:glycosyltransferase involved in cell wall biosynthesis